MRILVVDDEVLVASTLAEAVRSQGHDVMVAHDAEEALVMLTHSRPDAMLLDIALGELSGVDLLRRLRKMDSRLPVVVITGHASDQELDEARRLGVVDIVEKPVFLNRLTEAISALARPR